MFPIVVQVTGLSAERLSQTLPQRIDFNINLTLPSGEISRRGNQIVLPFVFVVSTMPPVVHITIKGQVVVNAGNEDEAKKVENDIKAKKTPIPIFQAVMTSALADTVYLARSLGLPPPIPLFNVPQQGQGKTQVFNHESII